MKENKSNGLDSIISQAIEEMKAEQGNIFLWNGSTLSSWSGEPGSPGQNADGSKRMGL